jgi:hypothetical protein
LEKERVPMKLKTLMIVLAVSLLVPTAAFSMASFDFPVVEPVVSFVEGDVTVKGAGGANWEGVQAGRLLASGDTVKTGPKSKAEISCATGKMRLYENTVIIVPEVVNEGEKRDIRTVTVEDGTGLFRIKKRGVQNGFEVKTTNVIAGVKGTVFAVQHKKADDFTRVAVFAGVVEVTDMDRTPGTSTLLSRGQVLDITELLGFGSFKDFDPYDVWYRWKRTPGFEDDFMRAVRQAVHLLQLSVGDYGEVSCPPVYDADGNPIDYSGDISGLP